MMVVESHNDKFFTHNGSWLGTIAEETHDGGKKKPPNGDLRDEP